MNDDASLLEFSDKEEFKKWLQKNHNKNDGIWIKFYKGNKIFTARDALEEAICFGWIDGLLKTIDSNAYKKYFSKRKDTKKWSDKNKALFYTLQKKGLVTEGGKAAFQPSDDTKEDELSIEDKINLLRKILAHNKDHLCLFDKKSHSRQKQCAGFYCDAKSEETKQKRIDKIIDALSNNYDGMLY